MLHVPVSSAYANTLCLSESLLKMGGEPLKEVMNFVNQKGSYSSCIGWKGKK